MNCFSRAYICLQLFLIPGISKAQSPENTRPVNDFRFFLNVTNNGISLIPSFSLGKPAAIVEFQAGRRYTFEPQFRFALEGKPWSFVFWNRYKLFKPGKFQMTAGAHPAVLFGTKTITEDGIEKEIIYSRRYLAGELAPSYAFDKRFSAGFYYLYSYGFDEGTRNTNMLCAKAWINNIPLFSGLGFTIIPQIYYLKMDETDGYYFTSAFILSHKTFPVSVSSVINKVIETEIKGKDFIWNVTLTYTFSKKYVETRN